MLENRLGINVWADSYRTGWREQAQNLNKFRPRIEKFYQDIELKTEGYARWGDDGVVFERKSLEMVLGMSPDDIYDFLMVSGRSLGYEDDPIKYLEYERPKQMIVEIVNFCRYWAYQD